MADKEHTAHVLGECPAEPVHSDIVSVNSPPGSTIPAFPKEVEEFDEIGCFDPFGNRVIVRFTGPAGIDAGDILPDHPAGAHSFSQRQELDCEVAARIVQSQTFSGDAEARAGGSADKQVRSEGRRGGHECVSTGRSGGSPAPYKKKRQYH